MRVQINRIEENLIEYRDLDSDAEFVIAKDSMGTQICHNGKFFPDSRDFKSVENAQEFLNQDGNLIKAFEFFKFSPEPSSEESLFTVLFGIMEREVEDLFKGG